MTMNYKGKPLYTLSEAQLVDLVEALAAELRMVGGTEPASLTEDIADLLPMLDEKWYPPKISGMLYKGVGEAGGK